MLSPSEKQVGSRSEGLASLHGMQCYLVSAVPGARIKVPESSFAPGMPRAMHHSLVP